MRTMNQTLRSRYLQSLRPSEPIYRDDADRLTQLDVVAQAMDRFDAQVLAYCQMGDRKSVV